MVVKKQCSCVVFWGSRRYTNLSITNIVSEYMSSRINCEARLSVQNANKELMIL